MKRWKQRPEGSTWGDFGENDQLGRVNLINEQQVLKGIKTVTEGKVFCLSLPLDLPGGSVLNPRRHPPQLRETELHGTPYMNFAMNQIQAHAVDVLSDDQVLLSLQYSTQWDAFAHVGALFDVDQSGKPKKVYYNGYAAGIDILDAPDHHDGQGCQSSSTGALKLGIENFAAKGMQGRAVLIDLFRIYGKERKIIGYAELKAAMVAQDVHVEPGDMLVLRTGFSEVVMEMNGSPDPEVLNTSCAVLDGGDPDLLAWISQSEISAICADNYAVEAYPAVERPNSQSLLPLHHHCLFKLGVPLAELWYLKDLAEWLQANNRNQFLLTAPPLRLPGAVGSPVTPIATV